MNCTSENIREAYEGVQSMHQKYTNDYDVHTRKIWKCTQVYKKYTNEYGEHTRKI